MDSFSDDEALARKEDSDEELVIDSKEKEKCELVEKLEGIIKENRENMEAVLRQADEYVKGTGEESKVEDVRKSVKVNSEFWEASMSRRIEYAKETGKTET